MNKITYENFDRKKFIKKLKKNLLLYNIQCKLKITQYEKEFQNNNTIIIEYLNKIFEKIETFSKGNIYYILSIIQEYYDILNQFKIDVQPIKTVEFLKDSHQVLLKNQNVIINKVKDNFTKPKNLSEDVIEDILKKDSNG